MHAAGYPIHGPGSLRLPAQYGSHQLLQRSGACWCGAAAKDQTKKPTPIIYLFLNTLFILFHCVVEYWKRLYRNVQSRPSSCFWTELYVVRSPYGADPSPRPLPSFAPSHALSHASCLPRAFPARADTARPCVQPFLF